MKIIMLVSLLLVTYLVSAQDVGGLKSSNTDLPQTDADRTVVNALFGSIGAVQSSCSSSLIASLKKENALATCASYDESMYMGVGDGLLREMIDNSFFEITEAYMGGGGQWLTPWQENKDFGVIRQLGYEGNIYYLTLDDGVARVIKFNE